MVNNLPRGCRLTVLFAFISFRIPTNARQSSAQALFDSCHSGTILDLPNEHKGTPRSTPQQRTVPLPPTPPVDIPAPKPLRASSAATPPMGTPPRTMSLSTPPTGTPPRTVFKVLSSHFHQVAPSVASRTEGTRTPERV